MMLNYALLLFFVAELLRQNHHHRRREEDRHLLEAADRLRWRDHLRLQVPHRGREDPLLVRRKELPEVSELVRHNLLGLGLQAPGINPIVIFSVCFVVVLKIWVCSHSCHPTHIRPFLIKCYLFQSYHEEAKDDLMPSSLSCFSLPRLDLTRPGPRFVFTRSFKF